MYYIKRLLLLVLFFLLFSNKSIFAEEKKHSYHIIDYSSENREILFDSDNYQKALYYYNSNINNYLNLCFIEDEKVLFMEYGTLFFTSSDNTINYYDYYSGDIKILSNVNEYDVIYLNEENEFTVFMCYGNKGVIEKSNVKYYPFGSREVSYYENIDDKLIHHITSKLDKYYKYNLSIDKSQSYLEKEIKYFSYDSHYFYDDFYVMCDDARNEKHSNSINTDTPYFNYYSFLPSRSYTNYSSRDLNKLFINVLGINSRLDGFVDFDKDGANDILNKSMFYENLEPFTSAEKIYGVNALTSLAWSCEESLFGKDKNAFNYNNVYDHYVYSENEEKINKFYSVSSSIYSHMKDYVSRKYCDVFSSSYVGSHIGDYKSGIASIYSYDPLFGEKVSSKSFFIDSLLGFKDLNEYSLGITSKNFNLYYDKDFSTLYTTLTDLDYYSLIILDEYEEGYKVQCDYSMNQTGEYNPKQCILYVRKTSIDYVIPGNKKKIDYVEHSIDFSEINDYLGIVYLYSLSNYDIQKEFVFRDIENKDIISYTVKDKIYKPIYKTIKQIKLKGMHYPFKNDNGPLVDGAKLNIVYTDNSTKTIFADPGNIVKINFSGNNASVTFNYKGVVDSIEFHNINNNFNDSELELFASNNKYNYFDYSFENIEDIDEKYNISNTEDVSTFIRDNQYNFSVKGINASFLYHSSDVLPQIINTFYFDIKKISYNYGLNLVLNKYGLNYEDSFDVSITRCFYNIDLINPAIMQVKILNPKKNTIFSIYHCNSDGDYIKMPTQFTNNYVRFLAIEGGKYYLYSIPTKSTYYFDDTILDVNIDNNGLDYYDIARENLYFIFIGVIGFVLYVFYLYFNRKEEKSWKDFKKLLQKVEFVQDVKPKN